MSLINDMLQDLDQQRQKQLQPSAGGSSRARSVKPWMFALAAFLLVAVLLWLFVLVSQRPAATNDINDGLVLNPEAVALPEMLESGAELEPGTSTDSNENTGGISSPGLSDPEATEVSPIADGQDESKSVPKKVDTQLWLADLLRAEQALAQDRLMLPAHDSAYLYYQRVLAVDPDNSAAQQGLARISDRYVALAESARMQGSNIQAQNLIERALQVNPDNKQALLAQQTATGEPAVAATVKPEEVSQQAQPQVVEAGGTSRVTPSLALREQRLVRETEALASRGQTAEAITRLEALITANDVSQAPLAAARNTLLGLYLQVGQVKEAEVLVDESTPPVLQACLSARVLLHQGEPATALSVLERAAVGETQQESCRMLLAGLYQRTGQYEAAESHYRRLIESFGERGRYWLGLALALDEQRAYAAASAAYRRVLQSADTAPELAAFAEQRLQQLGN